MKIYNMEIDKDRQEYKNRLLEKFNKKLNNFIEGGEYKIHMEFIQNCKNIVKSFDNNLDISNIILRDSVLSIVFFDRPPTNQHLILSYDLLINSCSISLTHFLHNHNKDEYLQEFKNHITKCWFVDFTYKQEHIQQFVNLVENYQEDDVLNFVFEPFRKYLDTNKINYHFLIEDWGF